MRIIPSLCQIFLLVKRRDQVVGMVQVGGSPCSVFSVWKASQDNSGYRNVTCLLNDSLHVKRDISNDSLYASHISHEPPTGEYHYPTPAPTSQFHAQEISDETSGDFGAGKPIPFSSHALHHYHCNSHRGNKPHGNTLSIP